MVATALALAAAAALVRWAAPGDDDASSTRPAAGSTSTSASTSPEPAAGGGSSSSTAVTEPAPATSSTLGPGADPNTTVPDTIPEDAVDVEELRTLLLTENGVSGVLPGAVEGEGGPLDLAAAAGLEVDATAERALLQTRHFEGGWKRAFEAPGGAVAYLQVYEFASPADAEDYLDDGVEAATAAGARPFEVPAIENAVGLTAVDETEEGAFTGHVVAFVRGARHFLVVVGGTDGGPGTAEAGDLAAAQLARAVDAED